jgi:hypothetical protein
VRGRFDAIQMDPGEQTMMTDGLPDRICVLPVARQLAEEHGVVPSWLRSSGEGSGRLMA